MPEEDFIVDEDPRQLYEYTAKCIEQCVKIMPQMSFEEVGAFMLTHAKLKEMSE